jgi:hypothetical protein
LIFSWYNVKKANRELQKQKGLQGSQLNGGVTANHRFHLLNSDHRTISRQSAAADHINLRAAAHINIDDWLDPSSPAFRPELDEAIDHYSARIKHDPASRLELVISTAEMQEAAIKFGHNGLLQLDGTFGLCDSRMLLFILLAVDDDYKGSSCPMHLTGAHPVCYRCTGRLSAFLCSHRRQSYPCWIRYRDPHKAAG